PVHINYQDGDAGLSQIEIGVPDPAALAPIPGRLGPAVPPDNIHAAVAVDVAGPEPVAGQLARQLVPNPLRGNASPGPGLAAQFPPRGEVRAVGQEHGGAVAEEVDESAGL